LPGRSSCPAYSLVKWYFDPPAPADFATFQYGLKVLSDFGTAATVVLGLLWAIRRD
jgi:hypothetical protein